MSKKYILFSKYNFLHQPHILFIVSDLEQIENAFTVSFLLYSYFWKININKIYMIF